jgi:hypothetical protein
MTEGEMKKVSAWIPQETLNKLEEKGYQNRAEAIRLGLECLLKESSTEDKRNPLESTLGDIKNPMGSSGIQYEILKAKNEELERRIESQRNYLKKEIERLTLALQESPDPVELADIKARFEGLQILIQEKDKRIMELTQYKEDIGAFANYFKSKAPEMIEAPAADRKKPWYKFW